jgi:hypothetical protein
MAKSRQAPTRYQLCVETTADPRDKPKDDERDDGVVQRLPPHPASLGIPSGRICFFSAAIRKIAFGAP